MDDFVELFKTRAGENERIISCVEEDIKALQSSKEDSKKQFLAQRDETGELTVTLKSEIDSGNNLEIL